jgi:hypothetical protein
LAGAQLELTGQVEMLPGEGQQTHAAVVAIVVVCVDDNTLKTEVEVGDGQIKATENYDDECCLHHLSASRCLFLDQHPPVIFQEEPPDGRFLLLFILKHHPPLLQMELAQEELDDLHF